MGKYIPANLFRDVTNLTHIDFHHSNLSPEDLTRLPSSITNLGLNDCGLKTIPELSNFPNLTMIDLQNNPEMKLNMTKLAQHSTLQSINLFGHPDCQKHANSTIISELIEVTCKETHSDNSSSNVTNQLLLLAFLIVSL